MASSRDLRSRIAESVTCAVCLETFNSPKSLPCGHTFCHKCIGAHCVGQLPGLAVLCPLCRKPFTIPANGLAELPCNFAMQSLVETLNEETSVMCEVCLDVNGDGSGELATEYCVDCEQKLCGRCSVPHKKCKSGPHQVRALDKGSTAVSPLGPLRSVVEPPLLSAQQPSANRPASGESSDGYHFIMRCYMHVDQGTGLAYYQKPAVGTPVGLVAAKLPFSERRHYFEIEIVRTGEHGMISVGAVPECYPIGRQPGWNDGSIGYHADDGGIFRESGMPIRSMARCSVGDRMGCGVEFGGDLIYIYFTKNGSRIYHAGFGGRHRQLYPAIGTHSNGEVVKLLEREVWRELPANTCDGEAATDRPTAVASRFYFSVLSYATVFQQSGLVQYDAPLSDPVALLVAKHPFSVQRSYFEIEIISTGEIGAISVGAVPEGYPLGRQPGWSTGGFGYHADDGGIFIESGSTSEHRQMCTVKDKMGCGVEYTGSSVIVYFTKNGNRVYTTRPRRSGVLYPAIGMHSVGEALKLLDTDAWRN